MAILGDPDVKHGDGDTQMQALGMPAALGRGVRSVPFVG